MAKRSWSDSQSSLEMLFVCLCPHWDVTRFSHTQTFLVGALFEWTSLFWWAWAVTELRTGQCGATYLWPPKIQCIPSKWTNRFFEAHNLPQWFFYSSYTRNRFSPNIYIYIHIHTHTCKYFLYCVYLYIHNKLSTHTYLCKQKCIFLCD